VHPDHVHIGVSFEEGQIALMTDLKQSGTETLWVLDVRVTASWQMDIDGKISYLCGHHDELTQGAYSYWSRSQQFSPVVISFHQFSNITMQ
jgi:hypothetical protein